MFNNLEDRKERNQGEDRRVSDYIKKPCVNLLCNDSIRPYVNCVPEDSFRSSLDKKSSARNAHNGWKETVDAYLFKLDLPGVKEHEVKLEIEDNGVMCISHKIRAEREERISIWSLVRGNHKRFYQRIVSPDGADVDKGRAEMNNGELIITVPKYQFRKPIPKVVQISRR